MSTASDLMGPIPAGWARRHLLSLEELSAEEITLILDKAELFKRATASGDRKMPVLTGKTCVNMFFENSTRTRTSFALAARRLGADVVDFSASTSSLSKGETVIDTAKNIEAMGVDTVVIRHRTPGTPRLLADNIDCAVINAGDGPHEHPTQGLLDIMTIRQRLGRIEGLTVAMVGDIAHSRTARSNIWGLKKLGAKVIVCGPSTLVSPRWEELGVEYSYSLDDILPRVDVLNLLRIQFERQYTRPFPSVREYALLYAMDSDRLARTKEDILILAPGPINRGVEVTTDVADGDHAAILEQVANGVAVRMAVLWLLTGAKERARDDGPPPAPSHHSPLATRHSPLATDRPRVLIKHGRLIDPSQGMDRVTSLLIEDGRIAAYDVEVDDQATVIDASGKIVAPGLIDMHVHLRDPGREEDETIETGTSAALAGGFTSVACCPNTDPPIDSQGAVEYIRQKAARANNCNVYVIACVSKNREGKELAEIGQLFEAGAVAVSDDGAPVYNAELMRRVFEYCLMFDKPVLNHAEILELTNHGVMHEGTTQLVLGLGGIPAAAEDAMTSRDIALAEATGGRLHMMHVSTGGAIQAIRRAKQRNVRVTAEVTPHHFTLTDECLRSFDPNFKMSPPLRGQGHVDACIEGLGDGTIDVIVSDHAPHAKEKKMQELDRAPFGIVGLETTLGLVSTKLIEPGHLDWPSALEKMTVNPARILDIPKGTLAVGADADVVIIDPEVRWKVDPRQFHSKSANTPFGGLELKGRAVSVIVGGKVKLNRQ